MNSTDTASPKPVGASTWRDRRRFISQFVTNPTVVGAVAPSSRQLAERIVGGVDLRNASAVLEYGPGTGAFTNAILPRLGAETRFIAIELNDTMARAFRSRHPGVTLVQDSVEHARRICDEHGIDRVDAVISGLPWASFDGGLQDRILDGIDAVLKPGGVFTTFGYHIGLLLPAGKRFYAKVRSRYPEVTRSMPVWRNLPPAFVIRARR